MSWRTAYAYEYVGTTNGGVKIRIPINFQKKLGFWGGWKRRVFIPSKEYRSVIEKTALVAPDIDLWMSGASEDDFERIVMDRIGKKDKPAPPAETPKESPKEAGDRLAAMAQAMREKD